MVENGPITGLPFMKMHGLGNDFVVIDARETAVTMTAPLAAALADRHTGIGCDQLILLEPSVAADLRLTNQAVRSRSSRALARLRKTAIEGGNLFAELMETVKCCSLGQITHALFDVGGQYRRNM